MWLGLPCPCLLGWIACALVNWFSNSVLSQRGARPDFLTIEAVKGVKGPHQREVVGGEGMALFPHSLYYIADKGGSSSYAPLVLSDWLTSAHLLPQRGPGSILSAVSGKGLIMVPTCCRQRRVPFPHTCHHISYERGMTCSSILKSSGIVHSAL